MRMRNVLLAGCLLAASVQCAWAGTRDETENLQLTWQSMAGPQPDGNYTIRATVVHGSFGCPDQNTVWTHRYQYEVTHNGTDPSQMGAQSFMNLISIPYCQGQQFCAVPQPQVVAGGGEARATNWMMFSTADRIFWAVQSSSIDNGMRQGDTWVFTVYSNVEPVDGSVVLNASHCFWTACQQSTGAVSLPVLGCELPPPPGGCQTKECPCLPKQFNVAQVYPATHTDPTAGCWFGNSVTPFVNAVVPGVLCLATNADGVLNLNAFVDPRCCTNAVIQFVDLFKEIPGSQKCPMTYPARFYHQSAAGPDGLRNIRTWWPLMYSMPGTKITLRLAGACLSGPKGLDTFSDTWCWTVVANPETFRLLIDLFHTSAIGLLEIPCIVGEDIYRILVDCADDLATAITAMQADPENTDRALHAQWILTNCEGLIFGSTIFSEFADREFPFDYLETQPDNVIPNGPPGNIAPAYPADFPMEAGNPFGIVGIIDTCENPCACKLITDLESIGLRFGISTPIDIY